MKNSKFEYKDKEEQGWDFYWENQSQENNVKSSRKLYDVIASFYRVYLIKGLLNHFIRKYFAKNDTILHAGCGSGQVDTDIVKDYNITALDISANALKIYQNVNGNQAQLMQGSIFDMNEIKDKSLDGIYNLGVMEHFTEEDILTIFKEFRRTLKDDGKMVIFWPPEFGLSVTFFKVLVFLFSLIGKKNIKFHPDEISRVQSKKQIKNLFEKADLKMTEYYFGIKDIFTYSVIVAEK